MSWFSLQEPVGTNWRLNTGDLKNTKRALSQLGYYKTPPERGIDDWADTQVFDGLRAFQKDNGLKIDAFMRPGGPTERTINTQLAAASSPAPDAKPNKGTCAKPAGFITGTIWDRILRRQGGGGGGRCYPDRGPGDEEQCEQLYEKDSGICRGVKAKRGAAAAGTCWRSVRTLRGLQTRASNATLELG